MIAITDAELDLIIRVLRDQLPLGAKVWAFGSRASGKVRRGSDLDLVVDLGRAATLDEAARLREAFSESDLPYRVDLVDWHMVSPEFRQAAMSDAVVLFESTETKGSNGGH